jgi:predicted ArsR family transcriptional regulator
VISNEKLWRRTKETEISIQIKRRTWNRIGHTLRTGQDTIEREVLDWNSQGQQKRGRPKQTWRRSVHSEALGEGKSWGEVKRLARNRIRWRRFVDALCP